MPHSFNSLVISLRPPSGNFSWESKPKRFTRGVAVSLFQDDRNKKELKKIKNEIELKLKKEGLNLKENWQLFRVDSRPVDFIGYRYYRGYTTLRRGNFLRIKRRAKKIYKRNKVTLTDASAMISYYGWLKHCNSYNFNQKYIRPYIDINKLKGVVSYANRKFNKTK